MLSRQRGTGGYFLSYILIAVLFVMFVDCGIVESQVIPKPIIQRYADRDYITVRVEQDRNGNYRIGAKSKFLGSVDWIVDIMRLDPGQFSSIADVEAKSNDRRTVYEGEGVQPLGRLDVPAGSFYKAFDIVQWDELYGELFGPPSLVKYVTISGQEDAVYLIRAYSGSVGLSRDPGEKIFLIKEVPEGFRNDLEAYQINMIMMLNDYVNTLRIYFNIPDDLVGKANMAALNELATQYMKLKIRGSVTQKDLEYAYTQSQKAWSDVIIRRAASRGLKALADWLKKKMPLDRPLEYAAIGTNVGKVRNRIFEMTFYATPMETSIIIVGDPFQGPYPPYGTDINLELYRVDSLDYTHHSGGGYGILDLGPSVKKVLLTEACFDDNGYILVNGTKVFEDTGSMCSAGCHTVTIDVTDYIVRGSPTPVYGYADDSCGYSALATAKFRVYY